MNDGFWPDKIFMKRERVRTVPFCGLCKLSTGCQSPKMKHTGRGEKKILIVGEAPGWREDKLNTQFVGESGQLLRIHLSGLGIHLDRDCWKTNTVICRPPDNVTPSKAQIDACRPNLLSVIKRTRPKVIILLGESAVNSILGPLWRGDPDSEGTESIGRWAGFAIPSRRYNAWICSTYHPAFILHSNDATVDRLFHKHMETFVSLTKRPYRKPPEPEEDLVQCIYKPREAAKIIRRVTKLGGPVAFDYETTCLKPDWGDKAQIISASICWGNRDVIAFPFAGDVPDAMREFLTSPCPKIACNMKFEHRWSRAKLDVDVQNWWWDTMLGAHVLDHRSKITSIKFQAFVLLGIEPYNETIKPFLQSKGASHFNTIRNAPLEDLLIYNGLDSLLEYRVALLQIRMMKRKYGEKG